MRKTFDALLRRRHRCCGATRSLACLTWPIALVTLNLVLIGICLLDAPVVAYAQHTGSILKPLGSIVTDVGQSGWIIIVSLVLAIQAATAYRLSPTLKSACRPPSSARWRPTSFSAWRCRASPPIS